MRMNWHGFLLWGGMVAGLVILALASAEGRWLFVGLCVAVGVVGLAFDVWRAKRRAPFR
jgi:type IV secretory pathway TrbD component